jgi:hypothetical protein
VEPSVSLNRDPGQADDSAVLVGVVTADGDQAADVRLVRAVPAVRPEPDRADVALRQVVAGQLGPGDGEAVHCGRPPPLDGVEDDLAAAPERAALRRQAQQLVPVAERLVHYDDAGRVRLRERGHLAHRAMLPGLGQPDRPHGREQAVV